MRPGRAIEHRGDGAAPYSLGASYFARVRRFEQLTSSVFQAAPPLAAVLLGGSVAM
jgi:hypothetical protein